MSVGDKAWVWLSAGHLTSEARRLSLASLVCGPLSMPGGLWHNYGMGAREAVSYFRLSTERHRDQIHNL